MENLDKIETAAVLSAVRAVLVDAPFPIPNDNPLKVAEKKLEANLKEFNYAPE